MIASSTFVLLGIMGAFGVILPLCVSIWWIKTHKEKISTILLGALAFFAFALVLEGTIHTVVFLLVPSLAKNVIAYTIYGALMAGLFEETGRYIFFKFVLKKRTNRETAISYGIGHGGFEALYILVMTSIQYIIYAVMINNGQFQTLIDTVAASGTDTSQLLLLPDAIASITVGAIVLGCFERITAMLFHVAMSIIVFYAVKKSKIALYFLAILLHALLDTPAALFQMGVITNQLVLEGIIFAIAVVAIIGAVKLLYNKDTQTKEVTESV
jgi:uncharacterized membrane protein YhfC